MKTKAAKGRKGRTAFVIIHGIGEQSPFDTLDGFTTNLVRFLKRNDGLLALHHKIEERRGLGGTSWNENFVSIDRLGRSPVDIHEFYWAYLTEEQITVPEVWRWVEETLAATKKFYRENKDLFEKFKQRRGSHHFSLGWVAWILRLATFVYPFLLLGGLLLKLSGIVTRSSWTTSLPAWFAEKTRWIVVGYLGDIALYTSTDKKSRYFPIRQKILDECEALVEQILQERTYDRVIIAGHSLGSVIAYDTLNRMNIKANLSLGNDLPIGKLGGFITFGSPLDKIAFFFREHTGDGQYVRRQILDHLHSFRSKRLDTQGNAEPLSDPLEPKLDHIPWVNYYCKKDPISGHLDFYTIDEKDNVQLDLPESWGVAHSGYWKSEMFYSDIVRRFL